MLGTLSASVALTISMYSELYMVGERQIIINVHNNVQHKSLIEISWIVSRPRSTIQSIIDRYGLRKRLENNSGSEKVNQYTGRIIIRMIRENRKVSTIEIIGHLKNNFDIDIFVSTVRSLVRNRGFHGRVARIKYFVRKSTERNDYNSQIIALVRR